MKLMSTLILIALLSGCLKTVDYGIDAICSIDPPTVSRNDTPQTIIEVDNFRAKWEAICNAS
jgi:hypothetical protein